MLNAFGATKEPIHPKECLLEFLYQDDDEDLGSDDSAEEIAASEEIIDSIVSTWKTNG